jgi:hypothetical protein
MSAYPRAGCHNGFLKIELPGQFFDDGYSLDQVLMSLYSEGASVRFSRLDLALDIYGEVDEFEPTFYAQTLDAVTKNPKKYKAWHCGIGQTWSGWGYSGDNRYRFYDKRLEQCAFDRGPWWRMEWEIHSKALRNMLDDGQWWESELEWKCAAFAARDNQIHCGAATVAAQMLEPGSVKVWQKVGVTFEGAYLAGIRKAGCELRRLVERWERDIPRNQIRKAILEDLPLAMNGFQGEPAGLVKLRREDREFVNWRTEGE